jgi:hypothetical protein
MKKRNETCTVGFSAFGLFLTDHEHRTDRCDATQIAHIQKSATPVAPTCLQGDSLTYLRTGSTD